jgi:deoxyribodipyrimidine photo-lyase
MPRARSARIRTLVEGPAEAKGRYVLYWMTAQRRLRHNPALGRAADRARDLGRPLLILEALRVDYPYASDRLHRFVLDGMREHARTCRARGVRYFPYVERGKGTGKGLLRRLAASAATVVTDDHPGFFFPRMLAAAARQVTCTLEAVDGCGLLPIRTTPRAFPTAHAFRRHLHEHLPSHLGDLPRADPLRGLRRLGRAAIPREVLERWPPAGAALADPVRRIAGLPIDHRVAAVDTQGGSAAGRSRLRAFLARGLDRYARDRNQPDAGATSGLSPYLHFGHVGAHETFRAVARRESWTPAALSAGVAGSRGGWWGMSEDAEAFLDQLVTWRELGFNQCVHRPDTYASYASLPDWARATLADHAADPRPHCYDLGAFERAGTHDEIWNAAQRQLRREGVVANYLRMLWGKKILHWTASPEEALEVMVHLNDTYALDGRDPNSATGILWCLGRHDRPWGPERPVFGTVRFMTSASTRRKLRLRDYLERFAPGTGGGPVLPDS